MAGERRALRRWRLDLLVITAVLMASMSLVVTAVVYWGWRAMPQAVSIPARALDDQLATTLWITGVAFVLVHFLMAGLILRRRNRAHASHEKLDVVLIPLIALVFLYLAVTGQQVWAKLHGSAPGEIVIEVTAEQFAWTVRYPGPDAAFGEVDLSLHHPVENALGIDATDPAASDDIVTGGVIVVPVDRRVELRLKSKDVLHSFFLPALRLKQDTLPGQNIPLRFTGSSPGDWEFACAEVCGLGHYRMRGILRLVSGEDYQTWLAAQVPWHRN